MKRAVIFGLSILLLIGCGSSGDAGKVAVIARSEMHAKSGSCHKVRDDAVNGRLIALYACTLSGVPPEFRLPGTFSSSTQRYCFGYAQETGSNMTPRFGTNCRRSSRSASAPQNEFVVHIYFCTTDTCAKEATQAQINAVSRQALASPLVERVVFLSKEQALEAMRQKHPEEVGSLPSNPFPDALTVIPKNPGDAERVANLFNADPALGIDKVDYAR